MLWSMRPNWIQRYNSKIHDICHLALDPLPPPLDVKFLLLFTPLSLDPSPIIVYTWPNLINWLVEAWMIFGVDVDSKSSRMILGLLIQEEVEWLEESLCDMRRCVACKERFCDLSGYVTLGQVVWYEGSNMAFLFRIWTPPFPSLPRCQLSSIVCSLKPSLISDIKMPSLFMPALSPAFLGLLDWFQPKWR